MIQMFRAGIVTCACLLGGCAPALVQVKPFVDVEETLLLSAKLKKNMVLQYVGTPNEVRAGVVLNDGRVLEMWVYNVKDRLAEAPPEVAKKRKTSKSFKAQAWAGERPYGVLFLNDELVKWGFLDEAWDWPELDKTEGDLLQPTKQCPTECREEDKKGRVRKADRKADEP